MFHSHHIFLNRRKTAMRVYIMSPVKSAQTTTFIKPKAGPIRTTGDPLGSAWAKGMWLQAELFVSAIVLLYR